VVGLHVLVLLALLGLLSGRAWTARLVPLMLGLTLVGIGNLLPRTRPVLAIGLRCPPTCVGRARSARRQRLGGYVVAALCAGGALVVLSAIAVPAPLGPMMILLAGPVALGGTCVLVRSAGRDAHG